MDNTKQHRLSPAFIAAVFVFSLLAAMAAGGGGYYVYNRLIRHERSQQQQIDRLQGQLSFLTAKINQSNQSENSELNKWKASIETAIFNYLAIGNSITLHGIVDYWWSECGMAASTASRDYFTLVVNDLKQHLVANDTNDTNGLMINGLNNADVTNVTDANDKYREVNATRLNFSTWERLAHDRDETFEVLDPWLDKRINLITIQLSENALDLNTFEADLASLVEHIQARCPQTVVIIIDDFWSDEKSQIKRRVCEKLNIPFADLSDIRGKEKYQAKMGSIVYDAEGKEHKIEHNGVAIHPGDEGMRFISEQVIKEITQYHRRTGD